MSNRSYKSPFEVVIDSPGEYVTRSGEVVTVLEVGRSSYVADCVGHYQNGVRERWNRNGRIFTGSLESQNDIVKKRSES